MKKAFKYYFAIWATLLALFNVLAFVSVGWAGQEKYTTSFWIGYVFISLCFLGQLGCAYYAFKDSNLTKVFYGIALYQASYRGLILSFIAGGLCMIISPLPYWIGVIVCAAVLAVNVLAIVKAAAAADLVAGVDKKIKVKTVFVKMLTADAQTLAAKTAGTELEALGHKVYEAIRYSDPMSDEALAGVEQRISQKFGELSAAVDARDAALAEEKASDLLLLITERSNKCKVLK